MTSLKTSTSSKAAMAIVVAAITLTAVTPAAFAAGPDRNGRDSGREFQAHRQGGGDMERGGMRMNVRGGGLLALGCGPNAAERIEHALVALSYRVNPTGEQVQLLDALKTKALDAQKELAATCDAVLPARTASAAATTTARPNMLEAMQSRLKIEEARVAALGDVLPSFEAFFSSLTDEQKATLEFRDHRPGRGNAPGGAPDAGPAPDRKS